MKIFLLQNGMPAIPNPMPSSEQVISFQQFPYATSLMIALGVIGVLFTILVYASWNYSKNMRALSVEQTAATTTLANSMTAVAQATKELSFEVRTMQREHVEGIHKINENLNKGFQDVRNYVFERTDLLHNQIQEIH